MHIDRRLKLTSRTMCVCLIAVLHYLTAQVFADTDEFDVRKYIGRSKSEIEALLGPPKSCKQTYQGSSCQYQADYIEEIIFIDDRSDWLLLSDFDQLPYDYRSIKQIGLTPAPPTVANPFRMRWDAYAGIAVVSMYGSGKYVSFIQVRAFTAQ
jgi:hypothetical protein